MNNGAENSEKQEWIKDGTNEGRKEWQHDGDQIYERTIGKGCMKKWKSDGVIMIMKKWFSEAREELLWLFYDCILCSIVVLLFSQQPLLSSHDV